MDIVTNPRSGLNHYHQPVEGVTARTLCGVTILDDWEVEVGHVVPLVRCVDCTQLRHGSSEIKRGL